MTMGTASRVVEYMQEQADGEPIRIVWFGGEPLLNYQIIDFISDELREKGLVFESEMISNGLLFDSTFIEKAKKIWNMKRVQITLDGTSQVYRKVKAYVTDIEDPLERVMQNIKNSLKAEIKVSIRLNIGLHNYSDMRDLVRFLCEEFKGEDNIYVYISPLIEIHKYSNEKKVFMYDLLDELNSKLNPLFVKSKKLMFSRKIINDFCMATGREAVTILPNGKIGPCENIASGVLLGDIYTKELNVKAKEEFGRRFYREDKCRPCPMYPNCYIVNGCPIKDNREGCDSVKVQRDIKKIKENMKIKCRLGASVDEDETAQ